MPASVAPQLLHGFASSARGLRAARALLPSERAFLVREFGNSLALEAIKLAGGGQPLGRAAWQPFGSLIQMDDGYFEARDPGRALHPGAYPVFAHEALHVWQRQHRHCRVHVGVDGLWLGLTQGRRAYAYDTSLADPDALLQHFLACNIEQQGQIWQDYVHSDVDDPARRPAKYARIARYVQSLGDHGEPQARALR